MAAWNVAILPNGKMVISTEREMDRAQYSEIMKIIEHWKNSPEAEVLLMTDAVTRLVEDTEFNVQVEAPTVTQ